MPASFPTGPRIEQCSRRIRRVVMRLKHCSTRAGRDQRKEIEYPINGTMKPSLTDRMRPPPGLVAKLLRVGGLGILGRRQRLWAWLTFLAIAAHAPVVAYVKPGDDWLLSVVVAALVAFVIVVDDYERRRRVVRGPAGE